MLFACPLPLPSQGLRRAAGSETARASGGRAGKGRPRFVQWPAGSLRPDIKARNTRAWLELGVVVDRGVGGDKQELARNNSGLGVRVSGELDDPLDQIHVGGQAFPYGTVVWLV